MPTNKPPSADDRRFSSEGLLLLPKTTMAGFPSLLVVLRRKNCVTATPILANAKLVLSHAKNVRSFANWLDDIIEWNWQNLFGKH